MKYEISIFIIITLFYSVYFYKQIQLRKKGIEANRLSKGKKPEKTGKIEKLLLFFTYGTAITQYLSIFFHKFMLSFYLPVTARLAGIIITACGLGFFVIAIATMKDSWKAGVDEHQKTSIVTNGIYRYSRNPAFVGFDLLYIGTVLALPNIIILFFTVVTLIHLHLQIVEEEKFLIKVFGNEYLDYKKATPRYWLI